MILKKITNKTKEIVNPAKIYFKELFYVYKYNRNDEVYVLLLAHALEKGMAVKDIKPMYGRKKAMDLIELLNKMIKNNNADNYAFREGYSVLKKYIEFKNEINEDIKDIVNSFNQIDISNEIELNKAGYQVMNKSDLLQYTNIDFSNFIKSKHSLRNASNEEIDLNTINEIVEITKKSPSACNRQPCKIYFSNELEKNKIVSKLVPGNKVFDKDIPYYAVITADRKCFSGGESMQWYLNAGIFVAYFTLALHSQNIGSCIFQYPDFYNTEKELRKVCNIDKSEVITCIVGFGKYPENFKYIEADRKKNNEILYLY